MGESKGIGEVKGADTYLGSGPSDGLVDESFGGSMLTFGKVWRRGRKAFALSSLGNRACLLDGMFGLGPQLVSGEKKGEVGLRRSGENPVLSEKLLCNDVALCE